MSVEADVGAWQDGAGGQDTGGSSGLVRGTAGYMRLRKESLVCLFTCHRSTKLSLSTAQNLTSVVTHFKSIELTELHLEEKPTCLKKAWVSSADADGL